MLERRRPSVPRWRLATPLRRPLGALLALALAVAPLSPARATDLDEYRVKSALICSFARFAQWPAATAGADTSVLRVMVLGDADVQQALRAIDGQQVGARRIRIEELPRSNDPAGADILFVAESERDRWSKVQLAMAGAPILTIGEMNGFLESGGIINLVKAEKKIRFYVNLDHARAAGVALSSRILNLASGVEGASR